MSGEQRAATQCQIVCSSIGRLVPMGMAEFRPLDLADDAGSDPRGDLRLQIEQVFDRAVVTVSPNLMAARGVEQLAGDPHLVTRAADTATQNVANVEQLRDTCEIVSGWLEPKTCACTDY